MEHFIIQMEINKYEGNFKDSAKDGFGIRYFSDGDKYVGYWKNDKMHGYGIYYFNNGNKYIGEWKRNNFDGLLLQQPQIKEYSSKMYKLNFCKICI